MNKPVSLLFLFFLIVSNVSASYNPSAHYIRQTRDCTENCLLCGGAFGDICIKCAPGYFSTSQGTCENCDQQCELCKGPSETDCLSCKSALSNIIDGRCHQAFRNLQTADIQLPGNSFAPFDTFQVYYQWTTDPTQTDSIDLYFVYPGQHWVGFGFGTQMKGADIITVEFINGQVVVTDRQGAGHSLPPSDISLGGTNDVQLVEYSSNSTINVIHVTRKLVTGDSLDFVLTGPGSYNIISAYSPTDDVESHMKGGNFTAVNVQMS